MYLLKSLSWKPWLFTRVNFHTWHFSSNRWFRILSLFWISWESSIWAINTDPWRVSFLLLFGSLLGLLWLNLFINGFNFWLALQRIYQNLFEPLVHFGFNCNGVLLYFFKLPVHSVWNSLGLMSDLIINISL